MASSNDPVAALREKARVLYEGKEVRHRSCGIALAETFGVPSRPYQALRKGGLTGEGPCGAVQAGRLVLGELLGDPDPAGPVTPALREAMARYEARLAARLPAAARAPCNALTAPFESFASPERAAFCTVLAAAVAEAVAETLAEAGLELPSGELPLR